MAARGSRKRPKTLAGKIVLSVGHLEGLNMESQTKTERKIDLADEVLVLNVGGYIGESTRSEIEYAQKKSKHIRYLEDPDAPVRT